MMSNQERVLHGLDSCGFYDGIPNICEVTECPYRDDKCGCVHELAHDAGLLISELLKAQEPRVLTLAELEHAEIAYAEDIDKDEIIPILVNGRQHDRFNMVRARLGNNPSRVFYPSIFDYNKRWRCWTSRPDNATREATPWE